MYEVLIAAQVIHALFTGALWLRVTLKKNPCDHAEVISALQRGQREFDADLDDLFDRLKRLTARKGMRAKRDEDDDTARNGGMLPGETPDAWKARMRRQHPGGVPKPEA